MSARGGKKRVKSVKVPKAVPVATNKVIEDDDNAVLGDQRALSGIWSKKYINRAVLCGSRIYPDSNASIKAKRPKYFDSTEGERDSGRPSECLSIRHHCNHTQLSLMPLM